MLSASVEVCEDIRWNNLQNQSPQVLLIGIIYSGNLDVIGVIPLCQPSEAGSLLGIDFRTRLLKKFYLNPKCHQF